jgi:hypothetical protein
LKDLHIDKLNISQWNDSEIVMINKPEALREKIRNFRKKGLDSIQIITDFDNTLNKNKYRQQIYDTRLQNPYLLLVMAFLRKVIICH